MNNYAVIFDMDGVIAHTNPYHAKAFEVFFDKYKIPYSDVEFEDHMYGKHNSYIMSHFFKKTIAGEELLKLENEKEGLFREIYKSEIKSIPNYAAFLEDLKDKGFKTGVATSAPRANMDLVIDGLGIRLKMESLLASENVAKHKPDPEVYLTSAQNLGVDPNHCVIFEDSFSGVSAAINANMKVVGVLSSHTKEQLPPCDLYIHDYTEIDASKILALLTK
ncbi:HAD family phosphatase [Sphingobacterium alkalisoli]|uniref:HAD family phosphatase n=1 Tax=Sphingobacterium alkalisoli TaxID=1874115 RepID=A0A4U0GXI7_9SPHI|nr:HAD family phosphatase [Sphingobacterium alkalisoli]TJY63778.1 HAD family phosphatase [Sphingobacterium alkalisoli]GGH24935.1 phosphatase [Sphingobacterium alkalisoli]